MPVQQDKMPYMSAADALAMGFHVINLDTTHFAMKDGRFIRGDVLWELLDKQAAVSPGDEPPAPAKVEG